VRCYQGACWWLISRKHGSKSRGIGWLIRPGFGIGEIIQGPLRARFAQVTVAECTVTQVDRVVKAIAAGHGPGTARLARSVLKSALGMAVRHGLLIQNPVRDIAPIAAAAPDGDDPGVRVLTPAEVGLFRAAAIAWEHGQAFKDLPAAAQPGSRRRSDIADVIDVLLGTGMRIGEVLALRWQDLDLAEGTAVLTGTIVASEGGLKRQPHTKSKQARGLRMPGFLVATLLRRRTELVADSTLGLVFPSRTGGPRDPSNVRSVIRRIRAGIGLEWVTPHTFRRTIATAIPELSDAALQLGHAGTRVTQKHYRARDLSGPDVAAILNAYARGEQMESPGTQK